MKWYNSNIVRIEHESSTTRRFWLKVDEAEKFEFKAGQFITMDLPIGDRRQKRWRSYSIANAPDGTNVIEFCIVHLEGGNASGYFFNEVNIGTSIKFKGPDGNFVLPETIENDLVFICTGTGIAPFRSMIQDIFHHKKPHKNIHLIFGTRYKDGILYQKELEDLVTHMPEFHYAVALSREDNLPVNGQLFELQKGYVHQIYLEKFKEKRPDVHFYLCGWTQMVDEAIENLIVDLGYDRTQVKYELYG
jgi:CDP-4-dehydro-6-deoxyglucose reductase